MFTFTFISHLGKTHNHFRELERVNNQSGPRAHLSSE